MNDVAETPASAAGVLNNGVEVPVLGFGVFQIRPRDTERAEAMR